MHLQQRACRAASWWARTLSRASAYGAITGTSTITPCRASNSATKPILVTWVSPVLPGEAQTGGQVRAHLVAVQDLDVGAPRSRSTSASASASVVLPALGRPVSQRVAPAGRRFAASSASAGAVWVLVMY